MSTVTVRVNGKNHDVDAPLSVSELLGKLSIEPSHVVVELNREIVSRERFSDVLLKDSDTVELLRFVGGG